MKPNIHPQWHHDAVVTCSCGNSFVTGATAATISVDICSKCHPFFTGEMRFVDRQGRVDKFKKKMEHAAKNAGKTTKATKKDDKKPEEVLSYRQILEQQRTEIKKAAQA